MTAIVDLSHRQTKTFQRRYLDAAAKHGDLPHVYWYINANQGIQDYAALWPEHYLPVVPVGADPEESRHWAELLALVFKSANPALTFEPYLTSMEMLQQTGVAWYEYPSAPTVDYICPRCGGVFPCVAGGYQMASEIYCGECVSTLRVL